MLDERFSHLYCCQSLHTLQSGLAAIADLLVKLIIIIAVSIIIIIIIDRLID